MKTFKQYCEADVCWSGYKKVGMKKKNGKDVPNCVPESTELEELNTNQLIKKLAADTIFKKKYTAAVAKVKEIMFKHGPKPRHGKEYYAGRIAKQFGLDPHVLALLVDEQLSIAEQEDKMSKELARQERLDAEIKKSLDARTKEFKEKINKLTYEKIKQALAPSKEPLKGYPHNEEVTISMDESVNEALKAGKGKGVADIDYVGDKKLTQKIEKMFKIKIKQTGNTTADVTGEKKDILNFLMKHYYYDNSDVMELHPEIVEDKDLEEFGGRSMSAADKANLRRRIADKRKK